MIDVMTSIKKVLIGIYSVLGIMLGVYVYMHHVIDEAQDSSEFVKRGFAHMVNQQYSLGLADFSKGIAVDKDNYMAFYYRGVCQSRLGRYSSAVDDYNQALNLAPSSLSASLYSNRACAKVNLGKIKEAFDDHDRAVELEPENFGLYTARGFGKLSAGRVSGVADFDRAVSLSPEAYELRAEAKEYLGDRRAAIEDLDQAVERTGSRNACIKLAGLKLAGMDLGGATSIITKLVALKPKAKPSL